MKRDPLMILARVRDAAVLTATRDLAGGLQQERAGRQALADHDGNVRAELAGASASEASSLSAWLQAATAARAGHAAALLSGEERVKRLQQALLMRRTEAKIVEAAQERAMEAAMLGRQRADQAAMDEVAGGRRPRT